MVVATRAASVIKPMATFDVGMNVTQIIYFFPLIVAELSHRSRHLRN